MRHVWRRRGIVTSFGGVKPEGQKSLGKPRRRCGNNIKTDLKEIGKIGVDCIHLHQDRDM